MSTDGFGQGHWEFPTHYSVLDYTITPEISVEALTITDCADSDDPKEKQEESFSPVVETNAAAVGIIGSADGPTAIIFATDKQSKFRTACSSLHFEPRNDVEWRMVFHEKQFSNVKVEIIS